jgi:hypothetical protein
MTNQPDFTPHDPMIDIATEKLRLAAFMDNGTCSTEECEEAFKKICEMDEAIIQNKATTLAGAIASLALLKDELEAFFITDDGEDVAGAPVVRSLLDGALGVLQGEERASC